jgi:hypothetical protein
MASFQEILNQNLDDFEAPQPLPVGTYLTIVDGQPTIGELGKNKNGAAVFNLKFMQATGDVDQHALIQSLKGKSLSDRSIRHTLWLTDDAKWRAKQFIRDHLGISTAEAKTFTEAAALSMGRTVMVNLGHRASDDGTTIYNDVKSTAKA